MKKTATHISLRAALTVALGWGAMADGNARSYDLPLSDLEVARRGEGLTVRFDLDTHRVNPGREREITVTPVVKSMAGTDSVELPAVVIAGRNRYYSRLRNEYADPEEEILVKAGTKKPLAYKAETPFEPWMERATVTLRREVATCCHPAGEIGAQEIAGMDYTVPKYESWAPAFVSLTGDSTIVRSAEGRAYVDFRVNRTEIAPDFRDNNRELGRIIESIDMVKSDPDAVITGVTIKGYASPDGPYDNNERLAHGRTEALKEYVRQHYAFKQELMSSAWEAEDWGGLREWLAGSTLPHADEMLAIANDTSMDPDAREKKLKSTYPEEYKTLADSVYPALRHSDYTVRYRIRTYADINDLKRIYETNPGNLRPIDFERVAMTMPQGSEEREKVYLTALKYYELDPQVSLNAATIAMTHGDTARAMELLNNAGQSPEAVYTRGVCAAMIGNYPLASRLLGQAAERGYGPARGELERVDRILATPPVTYTLLDK